MNEDKVNKILDELKWKLLSKLNHVEIKNHSAIELHETIENIVVDEIDKIKISTIKKGELCF